MLVAVDTGGTKTLIGGFRDGQLVNPTIHFPTPKKQDEYVSLLRQMLEQTYRQEEVEGLVVGLPGIIEGGVAVWCNNLGWQNFAAQQALAGVLGNAPVFIENDANLAGLAEVRSLDPLPAAALYVTISTGIGTGVITQGSIDPGLRRSEGGRMLIEFDGTLREWEDFASGQAIIQVYGKYAHDITSIDTWNEIADRISRGFLAVIPMLQPDTVIIGGSIGTYFDRYKDQLVQILNTHLPPHIPCPQFIAATHPEEAVLYGCNYYALDHLAHR